MQFGKWFDRGNTTARDRAVKSWNGIAVAHQIAGLGELRNIGKLKQALETRQMAKLLGVPPQQIEDEMLAGGDIHINESPGHSPWLWVAFMVIIFLFAVLGVGVAGATWFLLHQAPAADATTPIAQTTPAPQSRSPDYIEFYQP